MSDKSSRKDAFPPSPGQDDGSSIRVDADVGLSADRPLAVTFFSMSRVWGGAEEQTRLLAVGLRARGHRCSFVARNGSQLTERIREEGFDVITVFGAGRNPASIWAIRRYLHTTRPDVVHFVDPHAVTCGGLASFGLRIPARISARHNLFPLRMPARYRLLCDRMICVCRDGVGICRNCGIPEHMLHVVHNGYAPAPSARVDRGELRRQLGLSDQELLVLNVAHLNSCKGHRFLLEALPQVVKRRERVRLAVAGDGPLEHELKSQTHRLGIASHVKFLGFRRDIPELMQAADLFVLPSVVEAMSVARLEAMFAGCPIVTTTIGGTAELFYDGQPENEPAVWTAPPGDSTALAAAILEATNSREERMLRARRARERARTRFTVDRLVANTLAVYVDVINNSGKGPSTQAA